MRTSLTLLLIVTICFSAGAQTRLGVSAGFGPTWLVVEGPDLDPTSDIRSNKATLNEEFSRPIAFTVDFFDEGNRFITGFDIGYQKTEKSTGSSHGSANTNYFVSQFSLLHVGPNSKFVFNPRSKFSVYFKTAIYASAILSNTNTYESFDNITTTKKTGIWMDPRKVCLSYDVGLGFSYSVVYLELKGLGSFVRAKKGPVCDITTAYACLGVRFAKFNND